MSESVKYLSWFKGWVAFKHGKAVRTKDQRIRVFLSEQEAWKAARKSRMGFGV